MSKSISSGIRTASRGLVALVLGIVGTSILAISVAGPASAADNSRAQGPLLLAQAEDCGSDCDGRLEPRYQPREPEEKGWYNGSYIFGLSRGLADSSIAPAGKAPLFLFTIPLDIVLLPFAVIGGMFG